MRARRLPDGRPPRKPGEYAYMPYSAWTHRPPWLLGEGEWHLIDPSGGIGALGRRTKEKPEPNHQITVHEDGSITASPSLVMPSGWHGWLRRGELTV